MEREGGLAVAALGAAGGWSCVVGSAHGAALPQRFAAVATKSLGGWGRVDQAKRLLLIVKLLYLGL